MAKKSKIQAISVLLSFVIIITSIFIPTQAYASTSKVSVKVSNLIHTFQDADNYVAEAGNSFTVTFSRKGYSDNDCKISVTISSQDDIKYKINKNTVKITPPKSNNASVVIVRGEYDGKDYKNGVGSIGITVLPTHNKIDASKTYIKVPSPQKEMKIEAKALPLTKDMGHLDPYLITSASSNKSVAELKMRGSFTEEYFAIVFNGAYGSTNTKDMGHLDPYLITSASSNKSVAELKMRGSFTEEYFAIVFNGAYGSTNITLRTPSGVSKTIKVVVGEETTKPPNAHTGSSAEKPSSSNSGSSGSKKPSKNTNSNNKQDKTNLIIENEVTSVPSIIENINTPLSDVTDNPSEIPQAEIKLQVPEFEIKQDKKDITVSYPESIIENINTPLSDVTDNPSEIPQAEIKLQVPEFEIKQDKKDITVSYPEASDVSGYAIYLSNNDQDYYLIYIGEEKEYSFSKIEKNKTYYVKMKTYKIIENDAKFSDFGQVKEFTY